MPGWSETPGGTLPPRNYGSANIRPPQALVDALRNLRRTETPGATSKTNGAPTRTDATEDVAKNVNLTFCFDGGGSAITIGSHVYLKTDFPSRVSGWDIFSDVTGSVSFTVKGGLYDDFPTLVSLVAAANPAMTTARKNTGNTADLIGWAPDLPRDGVLEAVVDSISGGIQVMTLSLRAKRMDL